jgi:integrase
MGRPTTGPRYFASKGGYYVTLKGQRVCLAKGPENDPEVLADAMRKYHEAMLAGQASTAGDKAACISILDAFLKHINVRCKPSTCELWQRIFAAFCRVHGKTRVRDLAPHMVTTWLDEMETPRPHATQEGRVVKWGPSTRRIAVVALQAAFGWAKNEEMIHTNPIAKLPKPPIRSRGGEQLFKGDAHLRILETVAPFTRDLLIALEQTGARPGEIARVTAADYQEEIGAWVLKEHKADKTSKARVIYLTPLMVEMTKRLAALHPEGPIFRNRLNRPWRTATVAAQFLRLRKRLKIGRVSAYSYRHKFATDCLLRGKSMAFVAELQGNSVGMIELHYGHLKEHGGELRKALIELKGVDNEAPAAPSAPSDGQSNSDQPPG